VTISTPDGERFSVRGPVTPREVARLLQLFHESNLGVTFTADHEFLLVLDARDTVVGGVFYRMVTQDRVHFEKVVVARKHRGKNLSDALMGEFARRLRGEGVRTLETGFFQPDVIRRYGFRTDPTSGGLVLDLAPDDAAEAWSDPEGDAA
jgi:long-chain acyl-CoA synthetase